MKKLFLATLMLSTSLAFSQDSISGIVSDESNNPIPGATIVVQGSNVGVVTDFNGNYQINASAGDQLTFSSLGFSSQTITLGNQTQINISLSESIDILDEVVVSGYQTQSRRSLSGAIGTVDVDEAFKAPVTNIADALQGRVAGVTVISNGGPGSAPVVRVRGYSSTNGNDPLYVVDGVQTTDANVLRDINPNDIENISVLKDGAAAIYGARASNGVIVVTTKTGEYNSENTLEVNALMTVSEIMPYPKNMNLEQHADMIWQSRLNDGQSPSHPQYGSGSFPVIPNFLNIPYPAEYGEGGAQVTPGGTDWMDEITQAATSYQASIAASGGGEQGRYRMSLNYRDMEGVLNYTGFESLSARLNSELKIGKSLTIGQKINATYDKEQYGSGSAVEYASQASPLVPVYDTNGNFSGAYSNSTGLSNDQNPVADLYRARNNYNKNLRVIADFYANLNITENLTYKFSAGIQMRDFNQRNFVAKTPERGDGKINNNYLQEQSFRQDEWNVFNTLNYKNTFGDHTLDVLIGTEAVKRNFKGHQIQVGDMLFEDPSYYLLSVGAGSPVVNYAGDNSSSIFSLLATANWSYGGKYFATATIRQDDTSRFAQAQADAVFPSASVGWLVSSEDWFESNVFDVLKVRASYGEMGREDIGGSNLDVNISTLSEGVASYAFNGSGTTTFGAYVQSKGNPNLTWETTIATNFALDMAFLDNKLQATIDVFKNETVDLVAQDTNKISSTAIDAGAPYVNLGSMETSGFDLSLSYADVTDAGLTYSISAEVGKYKNEMVELIGEFYSGATARGINFTRTSPGEPISYFYGRKVLGIFQNDAEVAAHASQDGAAPGRYKYEDINGDGIINDSDRTKLGDPHPDVTFGLNFSFAYKNWDLTAYLTGQLGNELLDYTKIFSMSPLFFDGNRRAELVDSWSPSNPDAEFPALSATIQNNEFGVNNSFFIEDGSFIRMRTLQLGYNLSDEIASKIGASSARIFYSGKNLFTITEYSGIDPEIPTYGALDIGVYRTQYPTASSNSIGINLKF
jgi:TonB-linked SusC/RagA family outer membrane protein